MSYARKLDRLVSKYAVQAKAALKTSRDSSDDDDEKEDGFYQKIGMHLHSVTNAVRQMCRIADDEGVDRDKVAQEVNDILRNEMR